MKFLTLFVLYAWAEGPSDLLIQKHASRAFQYEVVEFQPIAKHHFELKAPNSCTPGVLVSSEKQSIKCQFSQVGEAVAVVNVCDDNKAYCKPMEVKIAVEPAPPQMEQKPLNGQLVEMKDELHESLIKDFISGTPEEILKISKKENKPVFLMISTDWCPPCNQSKEFLLSTDEFQKMTLGWIKVYVDGDSNESRAWGKILPFSYFPTMALLSSDLKEVSRYREELSLHHFRGWMERTLPFVKKSYATVKAQVLARQAGGVWQWIKDLVFFVGKDQKTKEQNYVLEVAIAKEDQEVLKKFEQKDIPKDWNYDWLISQKDDLIKAGMTEKDFAKQALALAGLIPAYLDHLAELCREDKQCPDMKKEFEERVNQLNSDPNRTNIEKWMAVADEYYAQYSYFKDLELKDQAVVSAKKCVETFEKLVTASKLKFPRYGEQGVIACAKAYDLQRVESLYLKMMERYPGDPTFVSRYVRFLKEERKDLKKAQSYARQAMDVSYDYNWFSAALTKVQIDQALGQKTAAQATIDEAFRRLNLSSDPESIDQKIAARFRRIQTLE